MGNRRAETAAAVSENGRRIGAGSRIEVDLGCVAVWSKEEPVRAPQDASRPHHLLVMLPFACLCMQNRYLRSLGGFNPLIKSERD